MADPKIKGRRFEVEVVKHAEQRGFVSKRAWGSDGRSLGLTADTDITINGIPFQCKRRKTIASYLTPSENVYGQIIRADRDQTYIVLRFDDFLDLLNGEIKCL